MRVTITIEDDGNGGFDWGTEGPHIRGPHIRGPHIRGPVLVFPNDDGPDTEIEIAALEAAAAKERKPEA